MRLRRDLSKLRGFATSQGARFCHKRWLVPIGIGTPVLILAWVVVSQGADETRFIYKREGIPDFKNASILGNPGQAVLNGEERLFSKQQKALIETQNQLKSEVEQLRTALRAMEARGQPSPVPFGPPDPSSSPSPAPSPVQFGPPAEEYSNTRITMDQARASQSAPSRPVAASKLAPERSQSSFAFSAIQRSPRTGRPGASLIAFPVKSTGAVYLKKPAITLPSGSYVKAKLLTGVEAPEGKTYPALLQLDYAFIIPNQKRLDLTGCFAIAKAQGDLSTERVQMQATKLSCVSKRGGMFEREINGFIADDADNSFAVMGSVNSKQDRVAAMAFLSSIVSGIGKAIQQAQTTQQTTPLGGSQSTVTGDQAKYIAAGGASEAATMVTQWYLKQAQNLLPTINVGSGQDLWVVLQDRVDLPKDYFTQNTTGGVSDVSIYSYFTRLVD